MRTLPQEAVVKNSALHIRRRNVTVEHVLVIREFYRSALYDYVERQNNFVKSFNEVTAPINSACAPCPTAQAVQTQARDKMSIVPTVFKLLVLANQSSLACTVVVSHRHGTITKSAYPLGLSYMYMYNGDEPWPTSWPTWMDTTSCSSTKVEV